MASKAWPPTCCQIPSSRSQTIFRRLAHSPRGINHFKCQPCQIGSGPRAGAHMRTLQVSSDDSYRWKPNLCFLALNLNDPLEPTYLRTTVRMIACDIICVGLRSLGLWWDGRCIVWINEHNAQSANLPFKQQWAVSCRKAHTIGDALSCVILGRTSQQVKSGESVTQIMTLLYWRSMIEFFACLRCNKPSCINKNKYLARICPHFYVSHPIHQVV